MSINEMISEYAEAWRMFLEEETEENDTIAQNTFKQLQKQIDASQREMYAMGYTDACDDLISKAEELQQR